MKCKLCGTAFDPGDKFCQTCGRELPQVTAPASKSAQTDEAPETPDKEGLSTTVGKNSILSNSQINTTHTTTNTTVNNTTIEDDTKKSVVCAVSGKRVLYIDSACCRVCQKDVSLEYYNEVNRRCDNCHQEYLEKYRKEYTVALESGGGIDRRERAELDMLAQQLHLTEKEKSTIESEIRALSATNNISNESDLTDLFEIELAIVKKDLFKKNDISSALLRLGQIFDQVQTNDEISCFYFLLKALKSPDLYITNFNGANYDEFWENYWLFIAHLKRGDTAKGMLCISENKRKFPEKKNEIILSETVYLIMRFQIEQYDETIDIANDKFMMIESISGNMLKKLYKSNERLLQSFDLGMMKFVNPVPPDEPGIKEYFNFFLVHLYKITLEQPKAKEVLPAQKETPAVPALPKANVKPALPQFAPKPVQIPNNTISIPQPGAPQKEAPVVNVTTNKAPALPPTPKLPMPSAVPFPKVLPKSPQENKTKPNTKDNSKPQKPVLPTSPPIPDIKNKINIPPIPPVPGKK